MFTHRLVVADLLSYEVVDWLMDINISGQSIYVDFKPPSVCENRAVV